MAEISQRRSEVRIDSYSLHDEGPAVTQVKLRFLEEVQTEEPPLKTALTKRAEKRISTR